MYIVFCIIRVLGTASTTYLPTRTNSRNGRDVTIVFKKAAGEEIGIFEITGRPPGTNTST